MLNNRLLGYLTYFERLAKQPLNRWDGFYLTEREESGFSLRLQLAFACYALAAICQHPAADGQQQERCRATIAALIARMQQRRVWSDWGLGADRRGVSPDPIYRGNLQYGGHLAMMIGCYEVIGGDARFDEDIVLHWSSGARFTYTHHTLIQAICDQMRVSHFQSVEDSPGRATVATSAHALWAATLHDAQHGGEYAAVTAPWLDFVRRKLVLRGPGRRAFSAVYNTERKRAAWGGTNAHDAWSLAMLAELAPELTHELAPRLLGRVRRTGDQAWLPVPGALQRREVADTATATGFCYLLAVALGDQLLAAQLLAYADAQCAPSEEQDERRYEGVTAPVLVTALFALGEAGGLAVLRQPRLPLPEFSVAEEVTREG